MSRGAGGWPIAAGLLVTVLAACGQVEERTTGAETPLLVDVAESLGVRFVYENGDPESKNLPQIMGGGLAILDADGDDRLDLIFANGSAPPSGRGSEVEATHRFYRGLEDGTFEDETGASGLGDTHFGIGVAVGDVDNDGDPDVLFTNTGPDQLYLNDGAGRFSLSSSALPPSLDEFSATATFCDFDRDGWLDLFVTRYVRFDPNVACFDPAGRRDYCGPEGFPALHDVLLHNMGRGQFEDVTAVSLIATASGRGLGVVCEDLSGDGWPDFVVANDGDPNHFWINQGDGTFLERGGMMGVSTNRDGQAEAGMGMLVADFNEDGWPEIFMTHLHQQTHTLYQNLGPGAGFSDATASSGLGFATIPFTGFGAVAEDVDLDGDLDLITVNGRVRSHSEPAAGASGLMPPWDRLAEPNLILLQTEPLRFDVAPPSLCPSCKVAEISRGLASADLDRDGDADFVVANIAAPARILRNDALSDPGSNWIRVRAIEPELRRDAIGARVSLIEANGTTRTRTVSRGTSYGSSSPPEILFSAFSMPAQLVVLWLDGDREQFPVSCTDCAFELRRGDGRPEKGAGR